MRERPKPVVYIAFANDLEHAERNLAGLAVEASNIETALSALVADDASWELIPNADCTPAKLIEPFYSNQVAIFHYGGHACPDQILLETETGANKLASAPLFADFLARQESLKLVFLNACSTRQWAENLIRLGVPCVVATSRPIQDDIALKFAAAFYEGLAADLTISQAFAKASAGIQFSNDALTRTIDLDEDCDHQSEGLPWAIYTGSSDHAVDWRLSIGASDPLIGLPPLDPAKYPLPESPYVSIVGHQEADAQIFFGRNGEIRELYDWVTHSDTEPPVLLFYGQSGVGKSSLLRAGLLPRLKDTATVTYRRRNKDLIEDLHHAIRDSFGQGAGGSVESCDEIAAAWLQSDTTRVIILDQVEEAITHHDGTRDEMSRFIERLVQIFSICDLATRQPMIRRSKAHLILSFRKEYLAEVGNPLKNCDLEGVSDLAKDFWLERLDCDGIEQVVMGPVRTAALREKYKLTIPEPDFADFIANSLNDGVSPIATILQIVLKQLWEAARQAASTTGGNPVYTKELYRQIATASPLKGFFDQQMAQLGDSLGGTTLNQGLELDLLYEHTTPLVTSQRRTFTDLQQSYSQVPNLRDLVARNKELHLLAEPDGDSGDSTALAHDTLASVVRREFELSAEKGARARRILENRVRDWSEGKAGDPLDNADLKVVEAGLPQMRSPATDERRLLDASKARRRTQRRAWTLGFAIAAALVASILLYQKHENDLKLQRQQNISAIKTLADGSATSLRNGNDFLALLQSMRAADDLQNSRTLSASPDAALESTVGKDLAQVLRTTAEVGEYPLKAMDYSAAPCAVAFNEQDRLRYRSLGGSFSFDGHPFSSFGQSQFPLICQPASGRFAEFVGSQLFTSRDGVPETFNNPPGLGGSGVDVLTLSPADDKLAYAPNSGGAYIVDIKSKAIVLRIEGTYMGDLAFNADGSRFASAGPTVVVQRLPSGEITLADNPAGNSGVLGLEFGSAGPTPFVAALYRYQIPTNPPATEVRLWNLQNSQSGQSDPLTYYFNSAVEVFAFNRQGTRLAVGGDDGMVEIQQIPSNLTATHHANSTAGVDAAMTSYDNRVGDFKATNGSVFSVGFSLDSKYLAAAVEEMGSSDQQVQQVTGYEVKVWDLGLIEQQFTAARAAQDQTGKKQKTPPLPATPPLDQLVAAGCERLQVYLSEMEKAKIDSYKHQDLTTLRARCKL